MVMGLAGHWAAGVAVEARTPAAASATTVLILSIIGITPAHIDARVFKAIVVRGYRRPSKGGIGRIP
jgi:hypothetical protein